MRRAEGFPNTGRIRDYGYGSGAAKQRNIRIFKSAGLSSPYSIIGKDQIKMIKQFCMKFFDELIEAGILYEPIPSKTFPSLGERSTNIKHMSYRTMSDAYMYLTDMGYMPVFR